MKTAFQILGLSFLLVSAIACKPISKEAALKTAPPPDAQKMSSFENSFEAMSRIESAIALVNKQKPKYQDDLVLQIKSAIENAECATVYLRPTATTGNRVSEMQVSGEGCPIEANYEVKYETVSSDLMIYTMTAQFLIKDPILKAKNDVYELNLSGKGRIYPEDKKIVSRLSFTGTALSVKNKTIQITGNVSGDANSLNPDFNKTAVSWYSFAFPALTKIENEKQVLVRESFSVALRQRKTVKNGKESSFYYSNDILMQKSDFVKYIDQLGMLALPN